jgi:hypothetical protein
LAYLGDGQWQPLSESQIASGAVGSSQLAAGAVSSSAIAAGAVTQTAIANNAVGTSQIADGTIVDADINSSAAIVDTKLATISTAGKVADSALSANVSKLGSSIESSEITDGTIV